MKIVYQGDIHRTDKRPVNRVDDYRSAQDSKLDHLIKFTNDNDAYLFLGGDQADSPTVSSEIMNVMDMKLKEVKRPVIAVLGQHDVPYHVVNMIKSPVYGLISSGAITHCQETGYQVLDDKTVVHFSSWETPPTEPIPGMFNILLGHISVFKGEVPFYWKGEGYTPRTLRKKYPGFDLYLCGDIHAPLVDRNVVVSGSMMRQGIDQADAKPRCYLIDTDTVEITPLFYKINEDAFRKAVATEEGTGVDLTDLVEAMKSSAKLQRSYTQDCLALAETDDEVKTIIQGVFNELNQ